MWTGLWTELQNLFLWKVWNSIASSPVKVPVDVLISWKEKPEQPCFCSVLEKTLLPGVHLIMLKSSVDWCNVPLTMVGECKFLVSNSRFIFVDLKFDKINFMSKTRNPLLSFQDVCRIHFRKNMPQVQFSEKICPKKFTSFWKNTFWGFELWIRLLQSNEYFLWPDKSFLLSSARFSSTFRLTLRISTRSPTWTEV